MDLFSSHLERDNAAVPDESSSPTDYYTLLDEKENQETENTMFLHEKGYKTEIQRFYKDQCIFLTGGTGFLGKFMVEKLIRACGDIDTLYILIREKKGKDPRQRLNEILDSVLYAKARQINPMGIRKIVPIVGDLRLPRLGISDEDRQTLVERVTIIINAAATVRFDEKLSVAAAVNVLGTKEVCVLARECKRLKALTHISTAYSAPDMKLYEEKLYEPPISVSDLELISELDDYITEIITPKIIAHYPNTYCFTKAVAEDTVRIYAKDLPVCIVRPSIVLSTHKEPLRAYTDSYYGLAGLVYGICIGMIRVMQIAYDKKADLVPVDLLVNATIASTYQTAKNFEKSQTSSIPIYNYVSGARNPITWKEYIKSNEKYSLEKPAMEVVWCYGFQVTPYYTVFCIYNFFLHFIPALLIDIYSGLIGKSKRMLKFYNKMTKLETVLLHFANNEWNFTDVAVERLWYSLSKEDQILFPFNIKDVNWEEFFEYFITGLRVYLVKEPMSTLPEAKKRYKRLYYMHQAIKILVGLFVSGVLYLFISIFM